VQADIDIDREKQSCSGIRTMIRSGSKVNQFVHIYLSTRNISFKSKHAFLSNLVNRQTNKQTDKQTQAKHVPPPLWEVIIALSCRRAYTVQWLTDSRRKPRSLACGLMLLML